MKRPTGWVANPQAMAQVTQRQMFSGADELLSHSGVDADTWLTPRWLLDGLGKFDLDPCAAVANPAWVCSSYFTSGGLEREWTGRVFMNPPYSQTPLWIRKHASHGEGISLVPCSVESKVWREVVWKQARCILLLHGRTRFANPDGSSTTGRPLRSVALIAWNDREADVLTKTRFAGVLLKKWSQR